MKTLKVFLIITLGLATLGMISFSLAVLEIVPKNIERYFGAYGFSGMILFGVIALFLARLVEKKTGY